MRRNESDKLHFKRTTRNVSGHGRFYGIKVYISSTTKNFSALKFLLEHTKERFHSEKCWVFSSRYSENCILNEEFNSQMTTIRTYFSKIRALFFQIPKEDSPCSPPLAAHLGFYLDAAVWFSIDIFNLILLLPNILSE